MGTRGWLIFVYNGLYYIIYNHFDSYPSGMGASLFEQINELMKRFNGNSQCACQHWGRKLAGLKWNYSGIAEPNPHPFNGSSPYENIEAGLADTVNKVILLQKPGKSVVARRCSVFIEYVWTINLDKGTLELESSACWSFSSVYYMSKNVKDCMNIWLEDLDSYGDSGYLEQNFRQLYAAGQRQPQSRHLPTCF